MPTRLGYLSLSSVYSCSGHVNHPMSSRCCYGDSLRSFRDAREPHEITWKIRVYCKTPAQISGDGSNNFTLLKKEEMEYLLDYCRSTYDIDFGYTIEEPKSNRNGENFYLITISMNRRKTEQKFVLTWIRHFYEFPFNMFMLDAMKFRNEEDFKEEHILNLLQVIGSTYSFNGFNYNSERHYRGDQCLCTPYKKLITVDRVKISNSKNDKITLAWTRNLPENVSGNFVHYQSKSVSEIQESMTLEYWQNPDNWEERRQAYLSNYKLYLENK